jgi:hypothetical protein
MLSVIMLSVIMLSAVMLGVMASVFVLGKPFQRSLMFASNA